MERYAVVVVEDDAFAPVQGTTPDVLSELARLREPLVDTRALVAGIYVQTMAILQVLTVFAFAASFYLCCTLRSSRSRSHSSHSDSPRTVVVDATPVVVEVTRDEDEKADDVDDKTRARLRRDG